MRLIKESRGKRIHQEALGESTITDILSKIEPSTCPYIILEADDGSYIQAVGGLKRMSIEARIYDVDKIFKHYVIGKKLMSKVWCIIECSIGPVRILEHELLDIEDAKMLFLEFFQNKTLLENYNRRNVTKFFK